MSRSTGIDAYIAEVRKQSGYRATWLPTTTVNPGDIGRLHGQRFDVETSLAALGIDFTVTRGGAEADYEFASSTVHVDAGATASAALGQSPAITMRAGFREAGGFLCAAYNCVSHRIERIDTLNHHVLQLESNGIWDDGWLIATEVVTAQSLIILISKAADAFAEIDCKADLAPVPIIGLRGAFRLGAFSGLNYRTVARRGVTPMFIAHGLTGRRRHTQLNPRGGAPDSESGEPLTLRQVLP